MELKGKTSLVTGGARRIGRAISLKLADKGVNVISSFRNSSEQASLTVEELRKKGVRAEALQADLTRLDDCDSLIQQIERDLGQIDILVNNASEFPRTPVEDLVSDRERFRQVFKGQSQLHMRAPLYLGLTLGVKMKARGWGRIVNIIDHAVASGSAFHHYAPYLATKYGLHGVTQALAVELAPEVTVNSVAPGFVIAPAHYSEETVQRLRDRVPLKREAGVEEIARDVIFLIESSFKTGSMILSDGGVAVHTVTSG